MIKTHNEWGLLRPISEQELSLVFTWRNEPRVRAGMFSQSEISWDDHLKWWSSLKKRDDQHYFIYENQGTPCGIVNFTILGSSPHCAAWGIYTAPIAPLGSGKKIAVLALDFAFSRLKLHKIKAEVLANNTQSLKFHQSICFKIEGCLRDQHKSSTAYTDIYQLGILQSEWPKARLMIQQKLTH